MTGTQRLLKVREVALVLGVSERTVYEMQLTGELPRVKVRSAVRIPEASLADWIAEHVEWTERS